MTIFRFSLAVLLASLAVAPSTQAQPAPAQHSEKLEDCEIFAKEGPIPEYECVDRNVQRKERRMADALYKARQYVEERERTVKWMEDTRRSPIYLDWSQAAWKQYVDQNCTVIGGASGGSSAWVSRYEVDCYSQELDRRIKFLEELAAGQLNSG